MTTATVTIKGQIVIPSKIRHNHDIKKGTKLCILEKGNQIILQPLTTEYFKKMAGVLNPKGRLTKKFLLERRKEKEREDEKWLRS